MRWREKIGLHGLAMTGALLLPVGLFAYKGLVIVFAFTAGSLFFLAAPRWSAIMARFWPVALLLFTLFLWTLTNTFVIGGDQAQALLFPVKMATLIGAGLIFVSTVDELTTDMSHRAAQRYGAGLACGFLLATVSFCLISALEPGIGWWTHNEKDVATLKFSYAPVVSVLLPVLTLGAWNRFGPIVASFVALVGGLQVFNSWQTSSEAALIVGLCCVAGVYWQTRFLEFAILAGCVGLAGLVVYGICGEASIFDVVDGLTPRRGVNSNFSLLQRLQIWDFTNGVISSAPFTGVGIDAIGSQPGADRFLADIERYRFSGHPHNAFMQSWAELGLPGAIIYTIATFGLARLAARISVGRAERAAASGAVAAMLLLHNLSFDLWASWLTSLIFIVLGAANILHTSTQNGEKLNLCPRNFS